LPTRGRDPSFHVGDAIVGSLRRASCASNLADTVEDRGQVVRVERDDLRSWNGSQNLAFRDRAHVADALRQNQIRLECLETRDVDFIDAAIIPHRGTNRGIDLPAR
jgi:hypothetical protein